MFRIDALSSLMVLAIVFFSLLTLLYSLKSMRGSRGHLLQYYFYIILTALVSIGAVLANNLILLLVFWGILGLLLYLLINLGKNDAGATAKKTFIIIGGSDAVLLLGICVVYFLAQTFQMDKIRLELNTGLNSFAFICIAIAVFAKAGAMPLHSWIPDYAEHAPLPVVAYLPAATDKLLGIYLLSRITLDLFVMNQALNIFLMLIGATTIIAAVMMALVQHNMKRLLGYHAVSQVGYMVLGIGTGNLIGIAGGIFHMLNHAVYKSCLFFSAGNVEEAAGTVELDKLGGLAKFMPITYISALIASFSISGVPPFNGFFSKWMIYQGVINQLQSPSYALKITAIFCLIAAMFGSGLTLASFMKLIHATFLGQPSAALADKKLKDVHWTMWLPVLVLAVICVLFGVFAAQIPLKYFIFGITGEVSFTGTWYATLSTVLILAGLLLGFLIFRLRGLRPAFRQDASFFGSETSDDLTAARPSGTEFYNTVAELGILKIIYKKAAAGFFDLYEQGKNLIFGAGRFLQYLHNGVLPTYLVWVFLGMLGLFLVLLK